MKKIIFAIFAVLCMITISCQTEYPDSMEISGGTVSVDNLPVPQGKFAQPAFVRIENQNNTNFELIFAEVPDALEYQQYIKMVGNNGVGQIRLLPQTNDIISRAAPNYIGPNYFVYKYTCEAAIKDTFEWIGSSWSPTPAAPTDTGHFFFGVSAAGTDGIFSDVKWSERINWWFN